MEAGGGIKMHLVVSGEHRKAPTTHRRKRRDGRSEGLGVVSPGYGCNFWR